MASFILTPELAKKAVDICRPSIEALLGSDIVGPERVNFYLEIRDPTEYDRVLYSESWGDTKNWSRAYDRVAYGKMLPVIREQMDSGEILNDAPWLFQKGDARYPGAVIENGQPVTGSGLPSYFDIMICRMVIVAIQALCRDYIAKIPADADAFFGNF